MIVLPEVRRSLSQAVRDGIGEDALQRFPDGMTSMEAINLVRRTASLAVYADRYAQEKEEKE
jgi:hypothetical protein